MSFRLIFKNPSIVGRGTKPRGGDCSLGLKMQDVDDPFLVVCVRLQNLRVNLYEKGWDTTVVAFMDFQWRLVPGVALTCSGLRHSSRPAYCRASGSIATMSVASVNEASRSRSV